MNMLFPLFVGLRYTWAKRQNTFISFVSLFAFIGMALGVFALIVVLSVMNGFDRELKHRLLRVVPHGFVSANEQIFNWKALGEKVEGSEGLVGWAPFVEGHAMIAYGGRVHGVEIQGVDPVLEPQVSVVHEHMLIGKLENLEEGKYHIIVGSLLARNLGVTTGDKISVTLPLVSITPAGIFPRSKRFVVGGVFEVGSQVDQTLVLMNVRDAQKLFRKTRGVDGLRLRFEDIYQAAQGVKAIENNLGEGYQAKDWSETQGSLFQAVKMEKTVVGFMLAIIVAVAAFNIVTSLVMMITEKRSDIAVMRTMGLSAFGVVMIFMVQGTFIGSVGIVIGALLGMLVAENIAAMVSWVEDVLGAQVFDPSVYFVTSMPSELLQSDVVTVCIGAMIVSFLATCYPAYRASQIAPAEALRYNS